MLLEFQEKTATILAATPNRELHGEDPKPYCSLRLKTTLGTDDLVLFHPQLRGYLFQKNNNAEADLAEQGKDDTQLRFPHMKVPLGWTDEMAGGILTFHYGTSEKSHIKLPGIHLAKIELEPMEGGTIIMKFSVTAHPDEKQMGRLGMMVGAELPISIEAPESPPDSALLGE